MSGNEGAGPTRFIEHDMHRMLLLDFSGIRDHTAALDAIAEAKAIVATQPRRSLLTITYIKGAAYSAAITRALQELAQHDAPYVKAAVVAGMSGLQRMAFTAISLFSDRASHVCADLEDAKRWLAAKEDALTATAARRTTG